jgi:hypothetical protein
MFQIVKKACFVEREHTNDDSIGANTVFEGLEKGDMIEKDYTPITYLRDTIGTGTDAPNKAYIIIGSTIALTLILVFLKLKSKPDKMAIPVQLEMPNMLPTDAELYGTNKITKKSIGATIIYLANMGYVKIETVGEKCEPNKLIKVKDLPIDFDPKIKRIFERVFKNKKTEVFFDDFGCLSLYESDHTYPFRSNSDVQYSLPPIMYLRGLDLPIVPHFTSE